MARGPASASAAPPGRLARATLAALLAVVAAASHANTFMRNFTDEQAALLIQNPGSVLEGRILLPPRWPAPSDGGNQIPTVLGQVFVIEAGAQRQVLGAIGLMGSVPVERRDARGVYPVLRLAREPDDDADFWRSAIDPSDPDRLGFHPVYYMAWGWTGEMTIWVPGFFNGVPRRTGLPINPPISVGTDFRLAIDFETNARWTLADGGGERLWLPSLGVSVDAVPYPLVSNATATTRPARWGFLDYVHTIGLDGDDEQRTRLEVPLALLTRAPPVPRLMSLREPNSAGPERTRQSLPRVNEDGHVVIPMRTLRWGLDTDTEDPPPADAFEVRHGSGAAVSPDSVAVAVTHEPAATRVAGRNTTEAGALTSSNRNLEIGLGTVTLAMDPPVPRDVLVRVRYADPTDGDDEAALQDANGTDAPSFRFTVPPERNESTQEPEAMVHNTGQTAADAVTATVDGRYQLFRTGNARGGWRPWAFEVVVEEGDPAGLAAEIYEVVEVEVEVDGGDPVTVRNPDRYERVAALALRTEEDADGEVEVFFDMPPGARLDGGPWYALRVYATMYPGRDRMTPKLGTTESDDEGALFGWEIGDVYKYWRNTAENDGEWADGTRALRMAVTGTGNVHARGRVDVEGHAPLNPASNPDESIAYPGVALTAVARGLWDADGLPDFSDPAHADRFGYRWWNADGLGVDANDDPKPPSGAAPVHVGDVFAPTAALDDETLRVEFWFLDDAGTEESVWSPLELHVRDEKSDLNLQFLGIPPKELEVSEHAPPGTEVGPPFRAGSPAVSQSGRTITYSLEGTLPGGSIGVDEVFAIDGAGQITVVDEGRGRHALNYERNEVVPATVVARDPFNSEARHELRILVRDGPNVALAPVRSPVAASDRRMPLRVSETTGKGGIGALGDTVPPGTEVEYGLVGTAFDLRRLDYEVTLTRNADDAQELWTAPPLRFEPGETALGRLHISFRTTGDTAPGFEVWESDRFSIVDTGPARASPAADAVRVPEGAGAATVRMTLRTGAGSPRPGVPYAFAVRTSAPDAGAPGAATPGEDFAPLAERIEFAPADFARPASGENVWQASRTLTVPIFADGVDEGGPETFLVELLPADPPSDGLVALADAAGDPCDPCAVVVTIEDADRTALEGVRVLDDEVVLRFSRELDAADPPGPGAFAVTVTTGGRTEEYAVEAATVSGRRVTLRLARPPPDGSRVTVAYRPDAGAGVLRGVDGQPVVWRDDVAWARVGETVRLAPDHKYEDGNEDSVIQRARGLAGADDSEQGLLDQLVSGELPPLHMGRLQVKLKHRHEALTRWGSVCDDGFRHVEASVACRAMGYTSGEVLERKNIHFEYPASFLEALTEDDEPIWLDDVQCVPGARGHPPDRPIASLADDCWHAGIGIHNCTHYDEDVFVKCAGGGPVLAAARVADDASAVLLRFEDDLDAELPAPAAFAVNVGAGWTEAMKVAFDPASPRRLRLTAATSVPVGARVQVRYDPPAAGAPLRGFTGVAADPFCAAFEAPGDGSFGACAGPGVVAVRASGNELALTFDERLAEAPADAFAVYVDGVPVDMPGAPALDGLTLTWTLADVVAHGVEVAVRHVGADGAGLRGLDPAIPFCVVFAAGGEATDDFEACPELAVERVWGTWADNVLRFVRVRFDAPPDAANRPSVFEFKLVVDGAARYVGANLVLQGRVLRIAHESPSRETGSAATVRLSYADPTDGDDANALQTRYGVDARSFCVEFERAAGEAVTDGTWSFCGGPRPASVRGDAAAGDALTVAFQRDVDRFRPAPDDAFEVRVEGEAAPLPATAEHGAGGDPKAVRLAFAGAGDLRGRPVQAAYRDPTPADDARAVQSVDGADAGSFCLEFRWPGDGPWRRCGPLLKSLSGVPGDDRDALSLTFDRDLAAGVGAGTLRVLVDGVPQPLSALPGTDAAELRLGLAGEVADGAAVRVLHDDPTPGDDAGTLEDAGGGDATPFCVEFAWPGDGTFGRCPELRDVELGGEPLFRFDAALDADDPPAAERFGLTTQFGAERRGTSLAYRDGGVAVTFPSFNLGSRIRFTYDDPTPADDEGAVQSVAGVDAASFCIDVQLRVDHEGVSGAVWEPCPPEDAGGLDAEVTVSGEPREASRLTAVLSGSDAPSRARATYRWLRVDADGQSNPVHLERAGSVRTYHPVAADKRKRIKVEATFADAGGVVRTISSEATAAVGDCADDDIGLVRGETRYEGSVEICAGGSMRSVCDDGWSDAGAGVACRQLGYAGGTATFSSHFGLLGGTAYEIRRAECSGHEAALHLCTGLVRQRDSEDQECHFSERAGAYCGPVAGAEPLTAAFAAPEAHDGTPFDARVLFSAPLNPLTANVAANLTAEEATLAGVAPVGGDGDLWEARTTPAGAGAVTLRLGASPACDDPGAMCAADGRRVAGTADAVVDGVLGTGFEGAPGWHDGATAFEVRLRFAAALAETADLAADVAAALTAENATLGAAVRVEGDDEVWTVPATPTGLEPATVRLAASPACGRPGALCTADRRRAAAAQATVPPGVEATFEGVPEAHDGATPFTVRVRLSAALADGADLALTADGATLGAAAPVDGDRALWEVLVTPTGAAAATVRVAPTPAGSCASHPCSADGRGVLAAEARVWGALTATFPQLPDVHGGAAAPFTVRIQLTGPLDAAALAALAGLLEVDNGTPGAVTAVGGRDDLFEVLVTPAGDASVTVRLRRSPACGEPGAACTPDGRRLSATEDTTVAGSVGAAFEALPTNHDGSTAFRARIRFSAPLAPDDAHVAANLTAANGTVGAATRAGGAYDLFEATVTPDGEENVTLSLAASPPCGGPGAMCAADGRRTRAAEAAIVGPFVRATFTGAPTYHRGTAFDLRIELSAAVLETAADALEGALEIDYGTVTRFGFDYGSDAAADVTVRPDGNGAVTLRLAASPPCGDDDAVCTADGRPLAAAETTVEGPVVSHFAYVQGGYAPTTGNQPEGTDHTNVFLELEFSEALPATADVAANVSVVHASSDTPGQTEESLPGVLPLDAERYDRWQVSIGSPQQFARGTFTVTLAPGPACGEEGAMCTAAGRPVAGTSATVSDAEFVTATWAGDPRHDGLDFEGGPSTFIVFFNFRSGGIVAPLAESKANVADNLTASGAEITAVDVDPARDGGSVTVQPAGNRAFELLLRASPACDQAGAMCTEDGKLVPRTSRIVYGPSDATSAFTGYPGGHNGTAFDVVLELSSPLPPATTGDRVRNSVHLLEGNTRLTLATTPERVDGRYDRWRIRVVPDEGDVPVTVRLPNRLCRVVRHGLCTADGASVQGTEVTVPVGEFVDATWTGPDSHDGSTAFEAVVTFSEALAADTANVEDNLVVVGATVDSVTGADTLDSWTIAVTPTGLGFVEIGIHGNRPCSEERAMCTAGGKLVLGTGVVVPYRDVDTNFSRNAVSATFVELPASHDGATIFKARIELSAALDKTKADVAGNLTVANGTLGAVTRVDRRYDLFEVEATPDGDADVTLRLAASPPCSRPPALRPGPMCTKDGRRVRAAAEATVPGPAPAFSVADARAAENAGTLAFEVTLDPAADAAASVDWTVAAGTATAGEDYAAASGTLAFAPGETSKTVSVALLDDAVAEADETLVLTLSNAVGAGIADATATGTIVDDDEPTPALSVSDARGTEGGTASFEVTLDPPAGDRVTVFYTTADGTARAGEDYAGTSGTLAFAPGDVSRTVPVALNDDDAPEHDETFTLELGWSGTGTAFADPTGTATIEDDDAPAVRLHGAPAEHGGADQAFEAGLEFSEEIADVSYVWVRDTLVTATDATVERAERLVPDPPENRQWRLTVNPASAADVTLGLTPGLTVPDGRPLRTEAPVSVRGPAPSESSVRGAELTLVWPKPRDGFGTPSGSDWAVAVNGAPRAVAAAEIAGRRAVLVLSAPVAAADAVTVGYVGSAMHPLADETGVVRSAPWDGVAVENATGVGAGDGGGPNPSVGSRHDPVGDGLVPSRLSSTDAPAGDGPSSNAAPTLRGAALAAALLRGLAVARLDAAPADAARLDASGLGLADLSALAGFTALERLDLSDNALTHLRGIGAHPALRELDLAGNHIADLDPLRALAGLERLDLSRNRIADVAPLAALPALVVLALDANRIADLGPLTHLSALEHLSLAENAVADLTPLQDLPRLRRLDLGGNPVADLSPLGDVASLEWLALPGEPAAAAEVLTRLTGLRWLWPGAARASDAMETSQ